MQMSNHLKGIRVRKFCKHNRVRDPLNKSNLQLLPQDSPLIEQLITTLAILIIKAKLLHNLFKFLQGWDKIQVISV